jgi:hypothetical protein
MRRRNRPVTNSADAEKRFGQQLVAIERHRHGLHITRFVEDEAFLTVRDQAAKRQPWHLLVGQRRVGLDRRHIFRRDVVGQVRIAGFQVGQTHAAVGDRLDDDLFEQRQRAARAIFAPPFRGSSRA